MTAWLPSLRGRPLPSSPLLGPVPESAAGARLLPVTVTALRLSTDDMVARALRLHGPGHARPRAWWCRRTSPSGPHALRFAAGLVARERFLPGLVESAGGWRARVDAGATTRRMRGAGGPRRRCPAAGRALSAGGGRAPAGGRRGGPRRVPRVVVDHLVRGRSAAPCGRPRRRAPTTRGCRALLLPDGGGVAATPADWPRWPRRSANGSGRWPLAAAAPFRLCFRLEEPRATGKPRVARPLPAPGARATRACSSPPSRPGPGRAARLLRSRPRCASTCCCRSARRPRPVPAHRDEPAQAPRPAGLDLDTRGAHEFLTQGAAALEQAGFGVLLPSWWTRGGHAAPPDASAASRARRA